jgi:hypothetical protein
MKIVFCTVLGRFSTKFKFAPKYPLVFLDVEIDREYVGGIVFGEIAPISIQKFISLCKHKIFRVIQKSQIPYAI